MNKNLHEYSPAHAFTGKASLPAVVKLQFFAEKAKADYKPSKAEPIDRSDMSFAAAFREHTIPEVVKVVNAAEDAMTAYDPPKTEPIDRSDMSFAAAFREHTIPEVVKVVNAAEDAKAHR